MSTWDNKAISGKDLQEKVVQKLASEIKKRGLSEVIAEALVGMAARIGSLEAALAERNLGERVADSLDAQTLKVCGEDVTDASSHTAKFSQASSRVNLSTGEKLSVMFGKIAKWFGDLKTVAFSGSYNDLSNKPLPDNIFGSYGPSVEQLTATDVSNGYKDFTYILKYGGYPGSNFTFWTSDALVFVSVSHLAGLVGQTSFPASTFTFEVYAGYESDPTKVLIRSVTKTDLTDTDDRGELVQDTTPVWNCPLLGSRFLVVCDRITVRVKWKSSSFGSTNNRIKASFTVAVMNPSGMTEWPQE